jgi:hypothetical protein
MPGLLSGGALRSGGSQTFIQLSQAQPQLPPTPTTSTGYTIITSDKLVTTYATSLGNINFNLGTMQSNLPNQTISLLGTGTGNIFISANVANTSTNTGALVVQGGVGISDGLYTGKDIHVNGLTIGQGWQGINNIVIQGAAVPQTNDLPIGQASIAIGWDALDGISTSYKSIAIGRYALYTGTDLINNIAIGDSALQNIGLYQSLVVGNITAVTNTSPITVTVANHSLTTGTQVTFSGLSNVTGMAELNNKNYYVSILNPNTVALYIDINVQIPLNGTGYSVYSSGGQISIDTVYNNNIAIGTNAANSLINGEQNFFLGNEIAINLTTGSNNVLIGHEVANNMISGNANISIGGDQLVDGLDNQVNIGSLLYYDGGGYTQINSDMGLGIGTWATATFFLTTIRDITNTNPVVIYSNDTFDISTGTEIVITDVVGTTNLNNQIYFASYVTATSFALYYDYDLTLPVDGTGFGSYINGGTVSMLEPYGALTVYGGAGISGNLMVTADTNIYGGLTVRYLITGTITTATNLAGGSLGSIPYQTSAGNTNFISIGANNTVLTSDGTTATWQNVGTLSAGIANSATNVFINPSVTPNTYYIGLSEKINHYSPLDGDNKLTYITTTANTSSYFSVGTNILNVPGSVYSTDGNPDEDNLLYTPRITISISVPPTKPRIGDFWIDPSGPYELQYVNDGGNYIWVQFTGL